MASVKESRKYALNEIIFRQGDESSCMYSVLHGKVGLFLDYGSPTEVGLAELHEDQFFGEMGVLDSAPRTSTAVALEEGTELEVISGDSVEAYFEEHPDEVAVLLMQMCARLRSTTRRYVDVCHTVREALEAETYGYRKSSELAERIAKYTALRTEKPETGADGKEGIR